MRLYWACDSRREAYNGAKFRFDRGNGNGSMKVQQAIEEKLQEALEPEHMEVINESHMHSVPAFSETHFKVVLVSEKFAGKRSVARHQLIYGMLKAEFDEGLHALALHTYTAEEWQTSGQQAPESPNCGGGSKAG